MKGERDARKEIPMLNDQTIQVDAADYGLGDYNLGSYRDEVITAIEATQPGYWLVQSWAVRPYSRRWFPTDAAARAEMLRIAEQEDVDLSDVTNDVTFLDCSLLGACGSSWMRLVPGSYEVTRYAADGHAPSTVEPVVCSNIDEARTEITRRRAARGLQIAELEVLRWPGDDNDVEAYHDFPEGHEHAAGCGGYAIRRCVAHLMGLS